MKGEKEEKQILEIVMKSGLNYWETLGMMEHIKMELARIMYRELNKNGR